MQQYCHQCGKYMAPEDSVYRVVKTGVYSGGGDFCLNVKVCPQCNGKLDKAQGREKYKKAFLIVVALAALLGGGAYLLLGR